MTIPIKNTCHAALSRRSFSKDGILNSKLNTKNSKLLRPRLPTQQILSAKHTIVYLTCSLLIKKVPAFLFSCGIVFVTTLLFLDFFYYSSLTADFLITPQNIIAAKSRIKIFCVIDNYPCFLFVSFGIID